MPYFHCRVIRHARPDRAPWVSSFSTIAHVLPAQGNWEGKDRERNHLVHTVIVNAFPNLDIVECNDLGFQWNKYYIIVNKHHCLTVAGVLSFSRKSLIDMKPWGLFHLTFRVTSPLTLDFPLQSRAAVLLLQVNIMLHWYDIQSHVLNA